MLGTLENEISTYSPEQFITSNEPTSTNTLNLLKSLYDFAKEEEKSCGTIQDFVQIQSGKKKRSSKTNKKFQLSRTELPLNSLIVKSFDADQVWEELQLQNYLIYETLISAVSKVLAKNRRPSKPIPHSDDDDEGDESEENEGLSQKYEESENSDEDQPTDKPIPNSDDDDGEKEDDEKEDEVEDIPTKTEDKSKSVRFNLLDDEEEEESVNASNFEKRRKKIEEGIELMEQEALEPKAWQFQGEVTANKRPENSLLEEHLLFDHLVRQAPEITVETTLRLEDIIKQRIKDQAWDDVIRKIKPIDNPVEYKKKLVMDSEKSRVGLAKIYEEEYLKQKRLEDSQEETEKIPEEQLQIEKDLKALFTKLDALSNFHYTPKPPSTEIRVVTNIPSIAMEEVAPVSVSNATMLAPHEIFDPVQGEIRGYKERTETDKKRERRIKKKKQHGKRIAREEKAREKGITLQHVTFADRKLRKEKGMKGEAENPQNSKELKSSKAFFSRLQEEAQAEIKGTLEKRKRKKDTSQLQAKKFKL